MTPTKRPCLQEESAPAVQITQKKRKIHHLSRDNLPDTFLTANALRELNRQNNNASHNSQSSDQSQRHTARSVPEALNETSPTVEQILSQLTPTSHKHLQRSARHGGPDLLDLRGYLPSPSNLETSWSGLDETSRTQTTTTMTRKTASYNGRFESHLINHKILPLDYCYPNGDELPPPGNLNAIQAMLGRRRKSLSPTRFTEHHFKKFRKQVATSTTETEVIADVLPYIQGEMDDREGTMRDVTFRNFEPLTDGTLPAAKPDLCFGAPRDLLRAEAQAELDTKVVPSQHHDRLLLPNNFLEVKNPFGAQKVARLQAMYDAALGCRAFHALQTYRETEATYDNNAYTLAWTYVDGILAAYTCHTLPPSTPGERPVYAMTHLKSWFLTSDIGDFRQAAAAFRNGRDWARLQREDVIARANNVSSEQTAD